MFSKQLFRWWALDHKSVYHMPDINLSLTRAHFFLESPLWGMDCYHFQFMTEDVEARKG